MLDKKLSTSNNPKDNQHVLFKKLTKFTSGPIINYKSQSIKNHRRSSLDKYANTFKDLTGRTFQKVSNNRIFKHISSEYLGALARAQRYADFEQMEFDPILASALDIYADEMTTHTQFRKILHIKCVKEEIKQILETLFYEVLNVQFNL